MRKINSLISILILSLFATAAIGCATTGDDDEYAELDNEAAAPGQFNIWKSSDNQFRFHLVAGNKNILLTSEGYTTRVNAINGMFSVMNNGVDPNQYEVRQSKDNKWYLVLKSAHNGQIIGFTQRYATKYNAQRAIGSCVRAVTSYLDRVHQNPARAHVAVTPTVTQEGTTRYGFNVYAKNGTELLSSRTYASEASAWNAAFIIQETAASGAAFKFSQDADGHRFVVAASNNLVIASSPLFPTRDAAQAAAESTRAVLVAIDIL
jgi:uncharacterized protein